MKRIFLVLTLLASTLLLSAQAEFYGTDIPEKLKKTTLSVVMSGSESYKVQLKQAVEQHWKLTPSEFIDEAGFETLKGDPDRSFIYLEKGELNGLPTTFITLALGSKNKKEQPQVLKQLIVDAKKISNEGAPMVHLYVKQLQNYVRSVESGDAKDVTFAQRIISSKTYRLKEELTLYALESDFDGTMTADKRSEIYRGKIKVVGQAEINDAVLEELEVAVADVILTGDRNEMYCHKRIYDASSGNLLYVSDTEALHGKKQGFIENDLSAISKAR